MLPLQLHKRSHKVCDGRQAVERCGPIVMYDGQQKKSTRAKFDT